MGVLNEAISGDVNAFEKLMKPYIKILYSYILSNVSNTEDTKDILQESMLAIWQGLENFKGNSSFKTWIIGIARRKIADFYRKYYKDKDFQVLENEKLENLSKPFDDIDNAIKRIYVKDSIDTLPKKDRELLFLIFNAGLTYKEIENVTGIPEGTVKSRIYYLKEKLRPLLKEGGV